MSISQQLITFAQDYLKKLPFDIVHDFEHHQLVVNNCVAIVEAERLQPNTDVLLVSAWWHDVEKSYKTGNSADSTIAFLRTTAANMGIDTVFVEQCVEVIGQHSFNQIQHSLEGKILFDADKIEYVNANRINKLVADIHLNPRRYEKTELEKTHTIWVSRNKQVPHKMHFDYSRQQFAQNLVATEAMLDALYQAFNQQLSALS